MGGRLYDPRIGRFLSPDPIISEPWSGQGWNLYSYVGNSPVSRTDPSGLCFQAGPHCPGARGGGGFTPVSPVLAGQHFNWRVRLAIIIHWSWAPHGFGSPWGAYDRHPGFLLPTVSFHFSAQLTSTPTSQMVSLGQEMSPADGRMPLPSWLMFSPEELVSLGIGFIPVVGTGQAIFEVITGRDLITGEEVHRAVALIGVVPGGRLLRPVVSGVVGKGGAAEVATRAIGEYGPRGGRLSLRKRMIRDHGPPPAWMKNPEAHHDLPRKFRRNFENAGVDIDDPKYGRWVERHPHRTWSSKLNDEWGEFFRLHTEPTQEQILRKLDDLKVRERYPSTYK